MPRTVVADTCCLINLLATGREVEIVEATSVSLVVSKRASEEALVLYSRPDEQGVRTRQLADLSPLQKADRLATHSMEADAFVDAFVEAATYLRDADASCVALAGVLSVPLVTDDAKERRVARKLFPSIELISTLDLLHASIEALQLAESELLELVLDLRWRGNFAPPARDPRQKWYADLLRRAGLGAL